MTKKLYVISTAQGCLTNLQETTNVRKSLTPLGGDFENTSSPNEADVIVVNTCGYNDTAESESVKAIEALKKKYPEKQIIIGGCLPKINPVKVQELQSNEFVLSSGEWDKLPKILGLTNAFVESTAASSTSLDRSDLETRLSANRMGDRAASAFFRFEKLCNREFQPIHNILKSLAFDAQTYVISVGTGCLGHCTYCAIKNAKGRLVSRPLAVIIDDFKRGLASGFKRFHLVGDDVGCWGQDVGQNSAILLREILKIRDKFEVVVNYFDPTWLQRHFNELQGPFADPRIICVNFPLQSGSTPLVRQMARNYDVEKVLEQISVIKSSNPTLVSKTHLMIGFPGETRSDFKKTLGAVSHFDLIFPNKFAPRIGTPAARNENQVSKIEKDFRFARLKAAIFARHSAVAANSLLGFNPRFSVVEAK